MSLLVMDRGLILLLLRIPLVLVPVVKAIRQRLLPLSAEEPVSSRAPLPGVLSCIRRLRCCKRLTLSLSVTALSLLMPNVGAVGMAKACIMLPTLFALL